MDLIAELIRDLHVEHEAAFSCPDPARVDGRVRSVTASGLTASLVRYGGFEYSAKSNRRTRRWPSCAPATPVS